MMNCHLCQDSMKKTCHEFQSFWFGILVALERIAGDTKGSDGRFDSFSSEYVREANGRNPKRRLDSGSENVIPKSAYIFWGTCLVSFDFA